jgi:hypothetical protein
MSAPSAPTITAAANVEGTITVKWGDTNGAVTHTVSISPGSFTPQSVTGKTAIFTGATVQTVTYTVSIYATNANGNSTTVTRTVDDFKRGLIWWIDVGDSSTITFGPNRTVGGYSFPTVTKIADKSGTGTNGNKDAVISTTGSSTNIINGTAQNPVTTTTGPVYISSLTSGIVQDGSVLAYAGYVASLVPTGGIDRPGLLFRGKSNTGTPSGYDSLQGYVGGTQTSKVPLAFHAVCKDLGTASFFGSQSDVNSYIGYNNTYCTYGQADNDALTFGPTTANKNLFNFVITGLYEEQGTGYLNMSVNGTTYKRDSTQRTIDNIRNFNTMRICGRSSGYTPSGFFSELMLHQRVLTAPEVQLLEGYMSTKWNLRGTLPSTHPYYNNTYPEYVAEFKTAHRILNSASATIETIIKNNLTSAGVDIDTIVSIFGLNYITTYNTDLKGIAIYGNGNTNGSWQYTLDNGGTWTSVGTSNSATRMLFLSGSARLRFVPSSNYLGTSGSLPIYPWDGTGTTNGITHTTTGTININTLLASKALGTTGGSLNVVINTTGPTTPPSLNNSPNVSLTSINEDITNPAGTTVASIITLLGSNYVIGSLATKGIAIYNAPTTNGNWQFSTNSGSSWANITGLSSVNHLILTAAGTTNMVRFVPATDFNGTSVISFRAWDAGTGTAGTVVAVNTPGGISGYSTGTGTVTITVNPVNDAPVMTGGYAFPALNALTTAELTPVSIETMLTSFVLTDADISNAQSVTSVAIIGAESTLGTWYYSKDNQATWTALTGVSAAAAVHFNRDGTEFVKFAPVSTAVSGSSYLQVRAWDKTNNASIVNGIGNASVGGTTTAYSANTPFTYCAVINKPSEPTNLVVKNKGGPSGGVELTWTAPSNTGNSAITAYSVYAVGESGTSTLLTSVTTTSATISSDLILGNTYIYNVNATNSAGESLQTQPVSVIYKGAPELVNSTSVSLTTIQEDNSSSSGDTVLSLLSLLGAAYTPANETDVKGIAIYNMTSTNGVWQYTINNGTSWINIPVLTESQHFVIKGISTNKIRFVPSVNYNGTETIQFRGWDTKTGTDASIQTVSATGGVTSYSSNTASMQITIQGANDAPTMSGSYSFSAINVSSGSSTPVSIESILSNFTITDIDVSNAQAITGIAIIGATTTIGTWYYSTDNQVSWSALSSVSATNAIHLDRTGNEFLKFEPASTTSNGSTSIQIRAWDKTNAGSLTGLVGNASIGGGTTAYSANTPTLVCQVNSVSTPPASITKILTGTGLTLNWSSPNNTGGNAVSQYKIYKTVNGIPTLVTTTNDTSITLTTDLDAGSSYTYSITAINNAGESSAETIQVNYAVNPQSPSSPSIAGSNGQASLTWSAPTNTGGASITGYKIYNAQTGELLKTVGNITATTITNLQNFSIYTFKVTAINEGDLESVFSSEVITMPTSSIDNSSKTLIEESISSLLESSITPKSLATAIINSIEFTNTTNDKSILSTIFKASIETIGGSPNLTQNITSTITNAAVIIGGITNSTRKESVIESLNTLMVGNAILASSPSEIRAATLATTILDTITAITNSELSSYKELSVQTAAGALLGNVDLPTATAVSTSIVMGTSDPTLKTGIFGTLAELKGTQSVILSGSDVTAIKDTVTFSNKTQEFTTITDLSVNIPNGQYVINITNEPLDKPIFLPMEPNIDYTIIRGANSNLLRFNSQLGMLYTQDTPLILGSSINIDSINFKIIQKGTTTIQYIPNNSGGGSGGGGGGGGGVIPCIVKGQRILTPDGLVKIETLKDGDLILTPDSRAVPVRVYSYIVDKTDNSTAPIQILAEAFGPKLPPRDLEVSPLHAVYKGNNLWEIPYMAMNRYKGIKQMPFRKEVTYYHIETPNYMTDHLVVEGCIIESFGGNYMKKHGLSSIEMYSWSPRKYGFIRYNPSQKRGATKV